MSIKGGLGAGQCSWRCLKWPQPLVSFLPGLSQRRQAFTCWSSATLPRRWLRLSLPQGLAHVHAQYQAHQVWGSNGCLVPPSSIWPSHVHLTFQTTTSSIRKHPSFDSMGQQDVVTEVDGKEMSCTAFPVLLPACRQLGGEVLDAPQRKCFGPHVLACAHQTSWHKQQ